MSRPAALLAASGLIAGIACASSARGILPVQPTGVALSTGPLVLGDRVPETATVERPDGQPRTLLSYKSALELLAVAFFADDCPRNEPSYPALRRLARAYRGWRVSFLIVGPGPDDGKLFARAQDPDGTLRALFGITRSPSVILIDEWGTWRYRGPVGSAEKALKTVISHLEAVERSDVPVEEGCPFP